MSLFGITLQRLIPRATTPFVNVIRAMKTHSATKKRFKITSSGKLVKHTAGRHHNTGKHSKNKIRQRAKHTEMKEPQIERNVRKKLLLMSTHRPNSSARFVLREKMSTARAFEALE